MSMSIDTEDLQFISSSEVLRLIGYSYKGLRKLEDDPEVCFPQKIVIHGRKYYRLMEIRNWLHDLQIQSVHAKLDFHGNKRRAKKYA